MGQWIFFIDAHAGSRTRVTSMGDLYDTATLHAPWIFGYQCFMMESDQEMIFTSTHPTHIPTDMEISSSPRIQFSFDFRKITWLFGPMSFCQQPFQWYWPNIIDTTTHVLRFQPNLYHAPSHRFNWIINEFISDTDKTPRPGIEPGSSAWQAEILTTILPRNTQFSHT
jgi:hypothetical protein